MKLTDTPDDVLAKALREVKDSRIRREAAYKNDDADDRAKEEKLENEALRRLIDRGAQSVKTPFGTYHRLTRTSATTADWAAFFEGFVLPQKAWEFLEHRPAKSSIAAYKEEHGDVPPGINWREEITLGFRRA